MSSLARESLNLVDETWRSWVIREDLPALGAGAINAHGSGRDMDKALLALVAILNRQPWLEGLVIEDDMQRLGDPVDIASSTGLVDDRYVRWGPVPAGAPILARVLTSSFYTPLIALGLTSSPQVIGLREGAVGPDVRRRMLRHLALLVTTAFDDEGFVLVAAPTVDLVLGAT